MREEKNKGLVARLDLTGNTLRAGLVTAVIIVTVLGLHEQINAALLGHYGRAVLTEAAPPIGAVAQPSATDAEPTHGLKSMPAPQEGESNTRAAGVDGAARSPLVDSSATEVGKAGMAESSQSMNGESEATANQIPGEAAKPLGVKWLGSQPSTHYTLQLLAARERRLVDQFIAEHPAVQGPFAIFPAMHGEERLFVLVVGSYENHAAAEAASVQMPEGVHAWIRDFSSIQQVLQGESPTDAPHVVMEIRGMPWLWSQNPTHYTIQLAAAADEATIETELAGTTLTRELAIVQTAQQNKPWFALIYGSFSDKASAEDAVEALPTPLKLGAPWIRRFSTLQEEAALAGREG